MRKSTHKARSGGGGETKTHLNKKEFCDPRKTFRTVLVYEEAEEGAKEKDAGSVSISRRRDVAGLRRVLWSSKTFAGSNYTSKFK